MKKFRISIYIDVDAETEEEAKYTGHKIAQHLIDPEEDELPTNYYNPYFGGAGEWIFGDLMGNHERMKAI